MLRCTNCKREFNIQLSPQVEFQDCPACGTGFLVSDAFRASINKNLERRPEPGPEPNELVDNGWDVAEKMRIQNEAMQQALDNFKANTSDNFFDSGYVDEKPMHPNCPCHSTPVVWNLQLSVDDIDSQRFTTCTIDAEDVEPEEITTAAINKMSEIFVNTFEEKGLSD